MTAMQKPRRRGRRARDQSATPDTGPAAPAYLTREIPPYALLGEEGLAAIEAQADWLLKEIGIEFRGDPEALALFRDAGADVQGERVRFEPGMVTALAGTAPSDFVQHARNPARSVHIGGSDTVFAPMYGAPFVTDLERGRRYGSIEDFQNLVKLTYMLPALHHSGGTICEPCDIPVNKRHLDMVLAHIRFSDKPYIGSITEMERAEDSVELSRILFGRDFVDEHCVVMGNINVNSPLVYDKVASNAIRAYAAANQAPIVVPFVLGGAMGPPTIAGSVAQAHAEALAGVALGQLTRRGSPVIYGNFFTTVNLRSGSPTFGMPESALAYLIVGQLARRRGLPFRCGGAMTASKCCDAQAMQESANSLLPVIFGGANFILHAAGWLEGALSIGYEKLLLDHDMLAGLQVFARGAPMDENAFATDAFREVGPGGHFFGSAHTLANYRDAYFEPDLADSRTYETWSEDGAKTAEQRAHERWRQMLEAYEQPPLDPGISEALGDFVAQRKASMPDSWH